MGARKTETAVREAAQEGAERAQAELEAAQAALADLNDRLAAGDSSTTGAQLTEGRADVDRAELLSQAAGRALEEAQVAEKVALARQTAEALTSRSLGDPTSAMDELRAAIVEALRSFTAKVHGTSGQVELAIREAREAGLVYGQVDPAWGVWVQSVSDGAFGGGRRRDVLVVGDRRVTKLDIEALAVEVLTAAFDDAHLALVVTEEP